MCFAGLVGLFPRISWRYVVLDEAQVIKNEQTNIARGLRKLHFQNTLLLTGTPLQNNLHELWSILNFLYPDIFQTSTVFDREGISTDAKALNSAHYMLRAFMLRRTKDLVEKEVPPKEEIKVNVALSPLQRQLYMSVLSDNKALIGDGEAGPKTKDFQKLTKYVHCDCTAKYTAIERYRSTSPPPTHTHTHTPHLCMLSVYAVRVDIDVASLCCL